MTRKIYLIYIPNTDNPDYEEFIFPNGLLYLYSSLVKNGFDTDIIMPDSSEFQDIIEEFSENDVVGISVNTSNRRLSLDFKDRIREKYKNIRIIMGGPFISLLPECDLDRIHGVDNFFRYESENTLIDYLNGKISSRIVSGERIEDLDSLSLPYESGIIYSNIITSRGCPGKCIYCSSPELWKRKLYFRSPENILSEIEYLYNKGVDYFSFSDDTFTFNKERVLKICHMIRQRNLKIIFDIRSRIDAIDEEIIEELALSGCVSISFGIESASPGIQAILSKKVDIEKAERILKKCRQVYIKTNVFLIVGNPGEEKEDIRYNTEFIRKTCPDWVTVYGLHYYPGTSLEKDYNRKIDWLSNFGTIYFSELNNIRRWKSMIMSEHGKCQKNRPLTPIPSKKVRYRSVFWKYAEIADSSEKIEEKISWLDKAVSIYESPELLFRTGVITENEHLIEKAYTKFVFQIENDIRKNPGFLENAISFFEYIGDYEWSDYVRAILEQVTGKIGK